MWLVKNASGWLCSIVFYTVLFSSSGIVVTVGIVPLHKLTDTPLFLWLLPYLTLVFLSALCHFRCMTTSPGTLPLNSTIDERDLKSSRMCHKCNCLKVMRAHHCSVCNRCVMRMDHHCPWVNNCVGLLTLKLYILFILYLFLSCVVSVMLLILSVAVCWGKGTLELCTGEESGNQVQILCGFYSFFMCLCFGCFLGFLLYDQVMHAITGTTSIENIQNITYTSVRFIQTSVHRNLSSTFGEPFSLRWFLPFSVPPPKIDT